jgi:hypothetical protein
MEGLNKNILCIDAYRIWRAEGGSEDIFWLIIIKKSLLKLLIIIFDGISIIFIISIFNTIKILFILSFDNLSPQLMKNTIRYQVYTSKR